MAVTTCMRLCAFLFYFPTRLRLQETKKSKKLNTGNIFLSPAAKFGRYFLRVRTVCHTFWPVRSAAKELCLVCEERKNIATGCTQDFPE